MGITERISKETSETLRVATDATWHEVVAGIMNEDAPGTIKVLPVDANGHKGFSYSNESPFGSFTRAAQNADIAYMGIIHDPEARRSTVENDIRKAYKDHMSRQTMVKGFSPRREGR